MSDKKVLPQSSFCAQCGPGIRVDEDGCCFSCGATAMGKWADRIAALLGELHETAENDEGGYCGTHAGELLKILDLEPEPETFEIDTRLLPFAAEMSKKLRAHDYDRGEFGWREADVPTLFRWLHRYHDQIGNEFVFNDAGDPRPADLAKVAIAAINVANLAMMVWDVATRQAEGQAITCEGCETTIEDKTQMVALGEGDGFLCGPCHHENQEEIEAARQ